MENGLRIGIISLGLIGGSILKALCKKYNIYCFSTSCPNQAYEYTKNISDDLNIVKECDIVFVCSPISKTLEFLNRLNNIVRSDCIVTDCASVKKDLLNKKFNYNFILSHPMAGREEIGFSAGCSDLFENSKWLIEKNNPILEKIIKDLGAWPYLIDMNMHDYMCASISHLPMLLAYALFDSTEDSAKYIASSGFRDATRLASNPQMSVDMLKYNMKNIDFALDKMLEKIDNLKKLSYDERIKLFKEISLKRKQMYNEAGKNVFKP